MNKSKTFLFASVLSWLVLCGACSRSNNLLLGEVQAKVGSHEVKVTDCYRTSVVPPQETKGADGEVIYRFTPCRDADVLIQGEQVTVNGVSYGHVDANDAILVDHGRVSINRRQARLSSH
ncbi:MAG: hypothetical protein WBW33_17290 [Bryobacteraceae bacterium]